MLLQGTFDFSHIDMVVVNQKDVYHKELVGKKQVILWHKEHCPKVFTHQDMIEILEGYTKSKFHRMQPSGNTMNIIHLTKDELEKLSPTTRVDIVKDGVKIKTVKVPKSFLKSQPHKSGVMTISTPRGPQVIGRCMSPVVFDEARNFHPGDLVSIRL